MRYAIQWVRSAIFVGQAYFMMLVVGILWLPWMLVDRRGAFSACKSWCRWTLWTMRWMCGVRTEVRGPIPTDEVLIAAKHQSFLDAILIFLSVPRGKYIMKRELIWAPVIGQYALRLGCVPVARGKRAEAIRKMKDDIAAGRHGPGQLMIYPQGSRIAPGVAAPYKIGTAALYEQMGQPCVPVACNVGLFWPRKGIMRTPGLAVVEFMEPIAPGMAPRPFMDHLEQVIETRSNALMREAGFDPDHDA